MPGRPNFRVICCLGGEPIPLASDVYALDEEWRRRFPQMLGILACGRCALHRNRWSCRTRAGAFVDGHFRAAGRPEGRDHDSWDHIQGQGTHVGMVVSHPWSGVLQGAEDYLRRAVRRPGLDREAVQRIQDALDPTGSEHRADTPPSSR